LTGPTGGHTIRPARAGTVPARGADLFPDARMNSERRSGPTGAWLAVVAILAAAPAAGCGGLASARMWADTALPGGSFSIHNHQWAYEGEPVTFELECDPGAVHYVVFGIDGNETVVESGEVRGRYRWTHAFQAGPKSRTYEVYARPFLMRGKCDWVYDRAKDTWHFYPGASEKPDVATAREQVTRITCYRREVRMRFKARGGPPKAVTLALVKSTGERAQVPRRKGGAPDARGFLLLGPDEKGGCEVAYSPTYAEVGRAGKTRAELLIEHADGSLERCTEEIDTP